MSIKKQKSKTKRVEVAIKKLDRAKRMQEAYFNMQNNNTILRLFSAPARFVQKCIDSFKTAIYP